MKPGFDPFGYNYQAHLFNGYYANAYLGRDGFPPYEGDDGIYMQRLLDEGYTDVEIANVQTKWYWSGRDVTLNMKWNDTWLSNKDCNGDGELDRGYACDPENANSSACEGAWDTNHQSGTYTDLETGKECHWTYFVKIIKAPDNATVENAIWYAEDGTEIGPVIWTAYAVIQRVYNDPCAGDHGIEYLSPIGPGFGHIK